MDCGYSRAEGAEGRAQFVGVAGRQILHTGVLRDAGQCTGIRVAEPEAHHMRSNTDPTLFPGLKDGAGTPVTAFQPVRRAYLYRIVSLLPVRRRWSAVSFRSV